MGPAPAWLTPTRADFGGDVVQSMTRRSRGRIGPTGRRSCEGGLQEEGEVFRRGQRWAAGPGRARVSQGERRVDTAPDRGEWEDKGIGLGFVVDREG